MKKIILIMMVLVGLAVPNVKAEAPQDKLKQIDSYIQSQIKAAHIPGLAIGIVKGNEIMYVKGYGKSITPKTPFILGSTTKSFTAMGMMQLVEEGKINLDASLHTYLPKKKITAASQIKVRNLLNQTSGIAKTPVWKADVLQVNTDHIGKTFEYSNENYRLLGEIIAAVTHSSYEDYIKTNIFSPLKMNHSFVSQKEAKENGMAEGYRTWFGLNLPQELPYNKEYLPAGYIIASAEDMTHYLIAQMNSGIYQNQTLLSETSMIEMHKPTAKAPIMGPESYYGMGWFSAPTDGIPTIRHSGEVPNFHSTMIMMPNQNYGIILLANINNSILISAMIEKIGDGVVNILAGKSPAEISNSAYLQTYLIMDSVLFILLLLLFLHIKHTKNWFYLVPINFVLPLAALAALPNLFGFTWSFLFDFVPDLTSFIMAVCCALLVHGFYKVISLFPKRAINKGA